MPCGSETSPWPRGVHISGLWRITPRNFIGGAFKAGRGRAALSRPMATRINSSPPQAGSRGVATAPQDLFRTTMAYGCYAWYKGSLLGLPLLRLFETHPWSTPVSIDELDTG